MTFIVTALDPEKLDRYAVEVRQPAGDGTTMFYSGGATSSEGVSTLKTDQGSDGTRFHFTGTLAGSNALSGEFSVTAWIVLKDALAGTWKLDHQK